ncbi:MAG: hypothetical protein J5J00_02880 [Deltaproteobacteria bacterium]|nr:hypothetical protein [Deltaproteobacteria bacterium]
MKCYLPSSQPFIRICIAALLVSGAAACSQKKSLPAPPPKPKEELPLQVKELDQKAADLYADKQFDKAVEVYDQAVTEEKQEPALYLARGRVKFQKRDFAGAEADYTEAIKLDGMRS